MKITRKILTLCVLMGTSLCVWHDKASAQQLTVSLQLFYDQLSPHGKWAEDPDLGYIWIPKVHKGFTPYGSDGHWVFTDDGWTWVSVYSWGWAPFHYGRWHKNPYYGWVWLPDTEWGPAWVSWRKSDSYYGWAPMGPGITVNIAIGKDYHQPDDYWIFVKDRDIGRPDVNLYYVKKSNNVTIIKKSTVIVNTRIDKSRNVTYISGPDKDDVQKVTGKPVKHVTIKEYDKPGQQVKNNELHIYRPQVQKNNPDGKKPAPSKVVKIKEQKQPNKSNAGDKN